MRVTTILEDKVKDALAKVAGGELVDWEVFARIQGPRESPEPVYVVGLFLPVSAEDQIAVLSEIDPYVPQQKITDLVRALWDQALELREQNVHSIAPGLVRRPRPSSSSGLIIP